MDENAVFRYLRELGCCDSCCVRYLGIKSPIAYEKTEEYVRKFYQTSGLESSASTSQVSSEVQAQLSSVSADSNGAVSTETPLEQSAESVSTNGTPAPGTEANGIPSDGPPGKRRRWAVCVSCLGVLQPPAWPECVERVKEVLDQKRYDCDTFACALSAPMASMLREKGITLLLADRFSGYDANRTPTPLKEAWKWSFGSYLAGKIEKTLDSGAICPLLITVNMEYPTDNEELSGLKRVAPQLFRARQQQQRRFTVDITRRAVEQALDGATLDSLRREWPNVLPTQGAPAHCACVTALHTPAYVGGRYVKLSRTLPQTPWLLQGKRVMESSVQEIIQGPLADSYGIPESQREHRLKFVAAGREDVDVRCLGEGRPFAVEISDPRRDPTEAELRVICDSINKDGRVTVARLFLVSREDLNRLKLGEETKCKTYEALCVKLTHTDDDLRSGACAGSPPKVTAADVRRLTRYRNTPGELGELRELGEQEGEVGQVGQIVVSQRTPLRVLHRRALLTRRRHILELSARRVRGHPQLFTVRVKTSAGTYVKEWAHGELGRSTPCLTTALGARVDLLALDVVGVHLDWCGSQ